MCHLTGGISSPYYVGLILCYLFVAALFTWPTWIGVASFSFPLLIYFGPYLVGFEEPGPRELSIHGFFLFSSVFLALLGMNVRNRLAFQAFVGGQALAQRNRELAELHEFKDRMFQNVSHELRTPLTLMLTPLQRRLLDESQPADERGWAQGLYRNGMRLLKQIDDLLDLARLDAKGVAAERKPVDVAAFLSALVDDLKSSVEATGQVIEMKAPPEPLVYALDPSHLERVVLNLLGNAVKFTPRQGRITVVISEDDGGLEIAVEDTGPGIPLEQQGKIFDRFQQVDDGTTRRHGGSGIGLALVDELVSLMGGTVGVASEAGRGSRFAVRFPLELAVQKADWSQSTKSVPGGLQRAADRELVRSEIGEGERLVAGTRGSRILVVEDDDRLRQELVEILASEHRVVAVANGGEGLREALLFRPQVVVSDVMMPEMDGVELCHRLRERPELKGTAVVLLTAKGELEDRIEGRKAGADSYLTKPFDVRELLATIEGLLRSRMHLVGEYLVQSQLGRGGQSEVWRAEHLRTGEQVALKITRPSGFRDARARRRLRKEHEALAQLEHPNIVKIVGRGEQAGGFFLAMEYLEGTTLDAIVREVGSLPYGTVAAIGSSAASALEHVHASGLLHRDVKCSNLMLLKGDADTGARVRLIDFGTAGAMQGAAASGRRVFGSLPYVAPELLRSRAHASPASDIYGLGIVLHRLSTGVFPYGGKTVEEIEEAIADGPAVDILEAAEDMPPDLAAVISRAMAPDPDDRWTDAGELGKTLAAYAEGSDDLSPPSQECPTCATATLSGPASDGVTATTGF